MNIADRRFVYNKRTDVAKRFRELGWAPPERHAEELESQARLEGAIRALKRLETEEKEGQRGGNVTSIDVRRRA